MVESIYFLKPAWCGTHLAGFWPEQGLQPVPKTTACKAVVFTARYHKVHLIAGLSRASSGTVIPRDFRAPLT
jgi:hypothetical protein